MAVLANRLPHAIDRAPLLENILDEHGRGDPAQAHEQTFRTLLARLGADATAIARRAEWPEVRAFNAALDGIAEREHVLLGLAAFGAIEDLFAGLSFEIGRAIVRLGWLAEGEIVHYRTHADLDELHADAFYRLVDRSWHDSKEEAYLIDQGLRVGGYVFLRLYEDLYRARTTRRLRGSE